MNAGADDYLVKPLDAATGRDPPDCGGQGDVAASPARQPANQAGHRRSEGSGPAAGIAGLLTAWRVASPATVTGDACSGGSGQRWADLRGKVGPAKRMLSLDLAGTDRSVRWKRRPRP